MHTSALYIEVPLNDLNMKNYSKKTFLLKIFTVKSFELLVNERSMWTCGCKLGYKKKRHGNSYRTIMGANQTRSRNGLQIRSEKANLQHTAGCFVISFSKEKIKIVNANSSDLRHISSVIKRYYLCLKEGWESHLTYIIKIDGQGVQALVPLMTDLFHMLYLSGWEPMTLADSCHTIENAKQYTTVCFKKKAPRYGSYDSILDRGTENYSRFLCIEMFKGNFLRFHGVENSLLNNLVECIQREWSPGVRAISMAIFSVLSDYALDLPPVFHAFKSCHPEDRFLQLYGKPFQSFQSDLTEDLYLSMIEVLNKEGYKTSIELNIESAGKLIFFRKEDSEVFNRMGKYSDNQVLKDEANVIGRSLKNKQIKTRSALEEKNNHCWWQQSSTEISLDSEISED